MRTIIFTLLILIMSNISFAQYKAVKLNIDSTKIYLRYFYKAKNDSDEILNDSVTIIARTITGDKFYLDKFINKRKIWTRVYGIELAKDSLRVAVFIGGNGKDKIEHKKRPYYNSFLIDEP